MAAATCQGQLGTGASVVWANIEGGVTFNLADSGTDTTTPVAIPTGTGTNYSWIKNIVLAVTVIGTTAITNRRISMSGAAATGLFMWYKDVAVASYSRSASGNKPADSGSNGATPAGYTAMTTTPVLYDNTSHVTSSTGPNGDMAVCVGGVDFTFAGGPGTATALPSIVITFDEA